MNNTQSAANLKGTNRSGIYVRSFCMMEYNFAEKIALPLFCMTQRIKHMKAWKIVLAIYLILVGLMGIFPGIMESIPFMLLINGVLAVASAVLLLMDK